MSELEEVARRKWALWGTYAKWHICDRCDESHYCRKHGRSPWLCLECWDQSEYA